MKITKAVAVGLSHRAELFEACVFGSDGFPIRWFVNGKCKTWKRDTERFELPVKHGLYAYGYVNNENGDYYYTSQSEALFFSPLRKYDGTNTKAVLYAILNDTWNPVGEYDCLKDAWYRIKELMSQHTKYKCKYQMCYGEDGFALGEIDSETGECLIYEYEGRKIINRIPFQIQWCLT